MEKPADLLVGNGRLITHDERNPLVEDGCVVIRGGRIDAIGVTAALRAAHPSAPYLDARQRVVMPGLINAHTHLYSAFARGIALADPPPANFLEILERLWWRLDKALTLNDVYWSAMVGLVACIRNGVTTVFDHHVSPHAVRGSLARIAEAARLTGLRACLCYEVSDRDGAAIAAQGIEENREFLAYSKQIADPRLRGLFGMHASFTLSDQTLASCRQAAAESDAGFHVHTAEALADVERCLNEHGMRVVERWRDFSILGRRTLAAHCVHVDEHEVDLLSSTQTAVVHNPESNMSNAVGCAPVLEMMSRGARVGLGTDAYTADLFESMKAANLLQKHHNAAPDAGWVEPPKMLFGENAAIASECFGLPIGKLVPGAAADLIVVEYDPPTPMRAENLTSHILFGLTGGAVIATIVDGRVLMDDRKLIAIDEREVAAKAREAAAKMWQRF